MSPQILKKRSIKELDAGIFKWEQTARNKLGSFFFYKYVAQVELHIR